MRWMVGLLAILLTGCQGISLLESPGEHDSQQMMALWKQYQRCRAASDPSELILVAQQVDAVMVIGVPPPAWLEGWGPHVKPQPLRTTLDPEAIGAACTLRAAALLAQMARITDARALYQRVLMRYSGPERSYYAAQARAALNRLSEFRPTMAASLSAPPKPLER